MEDSIKIGTRGSMLALYQAKKTQEELNKLFPDIKTEIVVIQTKGDKILDVALSKIGDKNLFTKEIEVALLHKSIDIAVHSLKDLATDMPEGLELGAVLERGEYRDALVHKDGKKLEELSSKDVVATSSLRRRAGLLAFNNSVPIVDIRGNVQTRLNKMESGHCNAMIMAAAGLIRLGLDSYITQLLDPEQMLPAVGQGAIAVQCRKNDKRLEPYLKELNHKSTLMAVLAERSFMNALQGGCQVPVGAFTRIKSDKLSITGFVSSLDGKKYLKETVTGDINNPQLVGNLLANKLIDQGGDIILDEIRKIDKTK